MTAGEAGHAREANGPTARAVFPGHHYHVTQRGNGRATAFFSDADYALYRDLLAEHAAAGVEVWKKGDSLLN